MKHLERGRAAMGCEGGYEALQSMLKGEYTEESTGARTIRQTGGKDRHSKVFTARGPRDRRVRLSVATAIRFYDLQDRLGFEQPSKAVEWLLLHCQPSIKALPQLASLHPVRVGNILQPAYVGHQYPHDHHIEQEPYKDEHNLHHQKEQKSYIMHPKYNHHNFTTHHNGPLPLYTDNRLQDSIEEDPPQYSNPSSSGASSDHLSEVAQPHCKVTLAEAIPVTANRTASSTGMRQCSTSFTSPATIQLSKRHRMQHHLDNQDAHATFASNSTNATNISLSVGRTLGINNGLSSPMNCSSFYNTANFNSLMINEEDAMLMNNSLQGQGNEDMRLPSLAYNKPNQYVDLTQLLFAAQANQLANHDAHNAIQGAACNQSNREADINSQACTPISMKDTSSQLYNKIASQQVDELVCSNNMYASPSPSESTSINTLAAAYSRWQ